MLTRLVGSASQAAKGYTYEDRAAGTKRTEQDAALKQNGYEGQRVAQAHLSRRVKRTPETLSFKSLCAQEPLEAS